MMHLSILRISAKGQPFATGNDTEVELQNEDGSWQKLRGVCSASVRIMPGEIIRATLEIEVGWLELTGVEPGQVVWNDQRSWWRRLLNWPIA